MKNSNVSLFELIGRINLLSVANYHRSYFGNSEHCSSLLKLVLDSPSKEGTLNNIGIITLQKQGDNNYLLVDGYQRILNIYLLFLALSRKVNTFNFDFNLLVNSNDKFSIRNIIVNDWSENNNIIDTYNYYCSELDKNKYDLDSIINNCKEINVINIILESNILDVEDVYANSNQSFTQVDLIRNFIYKKLKLDESMHIFNNYWLSLEKILDTNINKFIVDYLTIQNNGVIPNQNSLYGDFVEFYNKLSKYRNDDEAVKHINRYANYYSRIITSNIKDEIIRAKLTEINDYKAYDTYPYLMEVFEDYEFAHINKNILLEILDTVILFIKNRSEKIDDSASINFASLSNDLNRMLALKDYTPKIITKDIDENDGKITINKLMKSN